MATRYAKQTGKTYSRFVPHFKPDILLGLQKMRTAPQWSAAFHNQYLPARRSAMRPVLGQLRMNESAIAMGLQMEATLSAWRAAA